MLGWVPSVSIYWKTSKEKDKCRKSHDRLPSLLAIGWEGMGACLVHAIYMYMHGMEWDIWDIPFMMPGHIK